MLIANAPLITNSFFLFLNCYTVGAGHKHLTHLYNKLPALDCSLGQFSRVRDNKSTERGWVGDPKVGGACNKTGRALRGRSLLESERGLWGMHSRVLTEDAWVARPPRLAGGENTVILSQF